MWVRAACDFPPCRAPTGTPAFARLSARRPVPRWVLIKRIVFSLCAAICVEIKSLSPGCITRTWCSIVDTDAQSFCSEYVYGFFRYDLTSESIPRSRVPEKSRRCTLIYLVQKFILKLFVICHILLLLCHLLLAQLQIPFLVFYYLQDEVPDTRFLHNLHYLLEMPI
jgi:hypothetical protein